MRNDDIGDRMKGNYEDRTRICMPRRTNTIIRVDGKAFHTYTSDLIRPFDDAFMEDMDSTAIYLCENVQGAKFAYVQSDEISVLLTDYDKITTDAWFDNNIQKMASVSASMATIAFNRARLNRWHFFDESKMRWAEFDSRVFQIPDGDEVINYFVWRQKDCVRNSIISVAQTLYSHRELHGKNCDEMQEMSFQKGVNWNDYDLKYKNGRSIVKQEYGSPPRTKWGSTGCPTITGQREYIAVNGKIKI